MIRITATERAAAHGCVAPRGLTMTTHPWTTYPVQQATSAHGNAAASHLTRAAMAPVRILSWLAACHRRATERAELRSLDEHLVRDLDPGLVREEACKRFWMD